MGLQRIALETFHKYRLVTAEKSCHGSQCSTGYLGTAVARRYVNSASQANTVTDVVPQKGGISVTRDVHQLP